MAKNSYQTDYNPQITNYLSRDFGSLKQSLIQYTKTYFPDVYQDFNETSPGMMLIEMSAYVGDVLSFYIDQQYKELLLPLAEERRNIINMAKMLGYKVKPIVPSFVELSFTNPPVHTALVIDKSSETVIINLPAALFADVNGKFDILNASEPVIPESPSE